MPHQLEIEESLNRFYINACQTCGGTLNLRRDQFGFYLRCVNCARESHPVFKEKATENLQREPAAAWISDA